MKLPKVFNSLKSSVRPPTAKQTKAYPADLSGRTPSWQQNERAEAGDSYAGPSDMAGRQVSLKELNAALRSINRDANKVLGFKNRNAARLLTLVGSGASLLGAGALSGVGLPIGAIAGIAGATIAVLGVSVAVLAGAGLRSLLRKSLAETSPQMATVEGQQAVQATVAALSSRQDMGEKLSRQEKSDLQASLQLLRKQSLQNRIGVLQHMAQALEGQKKAGMPLTRGESKLLANTGKVLHKVDASFSRSLKTQALQALAAPLVAVDAFFAAHGHGFYPVTTTEDFYVDSARKRFRGNDELVDLSKFGEQDWLGLLSQGLHAA